MATGAGLEVADGDGTTLVTTVVGAAEGLAIGAVSRLVFTRDSKLSMRAASRL